MIFPGMDPYLEDPQLWPGVHSRLIVYLADQLQSLVQPRYVTTVEERVYVECPDRPIIPDVAVHRRESRDVAARPSAAVAEADQPVLVQLPELEVRETYVAILDRHSGEDVVTVIEVVSPSNKFSGPGRDSYRAKQQEIRRSRTHLVEIDLLRTGRHVVAVAEWASRGRGPYEYLACVNRAAGVRDSFELYPRRLQERLPRVGIPLRGEDPDVPLDIQAVVEQVYEAGRYAARIDYQQPCRPPLADEDSQWARELIAASQQDSP